MDAGAPLALPLMQLTRLRAELFYAVAERSDRLFPDDHLIAVEFGAVARVCLNDWVRGNAIARPDAPREAISVRKLAASLGRSPETARRRVATLKAMGAVTVSGDGVALAATPENEERVRRYYLNAHDGFMRLIESVGETCDLDLGVAETPSFGIRDVIERALDLLLGAIDTHKLSVETSLAHYLWGALCVVAVREVTYDPVLSRLYATDLPPDAIRVPISLNRLATALSQPYATLWRAAQALQEHGLATRLPEGWTVLCGNLLTVGVHNMGEIPAMWLLRKLRELAALGLDPARAADYYVEGRPALASLGLDPPKRA